MKKDLYDIVTRKVKKIREQGEPPKSHLFSLDKYVCDLCKGVIGRADLSQCPFCGRWVCREKCWHKSYGCCNSCYGVIKLYKESTKLATRSPQTEQSEKLVSTRKSLLKKLIGK